MTTLTVKYRPTRFGDVVGQSAVIKSLQSVIKHGTARSFILTGPSGVGKTTVARLIASAVGCSPENIIEIDAATYTGIDSMRLITDTLRYRPLGSNACRVVVVDEAHALSKQAWQSLLKGVEEPPPGVYWVFCSTDPTKIPVTIKTRCAHYDFKPLSTDDVIGIITDVADSEGMKLSEDVLAFVADQSEGSARQALSILAQVSRCPDVDHAARILKTAQATDTEVIDLCRALVRGQRSWPKLMSIIRRMGDVNPESVRQVVLDYFGKVAMSAKTPKSAAAAVEVIDAFSEPYTIGRGPAPVILSLGRLLFSE